MNEFPWNEETFASAAAGYANIENMEWLKENKCPLNEKTFKYAVSFGTFEAMKWLLVNKCPWDDYAFRYEAEHKYIKILEWMKDNGYRAPYRNENPANHW